jgi:hypothetical protein
MRTAIAPGRGVGQSAAMTSLDCKILRRAAEAATQVAASTDDCNWRLVFNTANPSALYLTYKIGIIGPGLLLSSGNALHEGGPASSLISFSLVGLIVFFVM